MKRYITAALLTAAILFPLFWYVYQKGTEDGVARYKRSRNFCLTLTVMFNQGVLDGHLMSDEMCMEDRHVVHQPH